MQASLKGEAWGGVLAEVRSRQRSRETHGASADTQPCAHLPSGKGCAEAILRPAEEHSGPQCRRLA